MEYVRFLCSSMFLFLCFHTTTFSAEQPCSLYQTESTEVHVNCSRRGATHMPIELTTLDASNVTMLDLSWNRLQEIDSAIVERFFLLRTIILSGNTYLGLKGIKDDLQSVSNVHPRKIALDRVEQNSAQTVFLHQDVFCVDIYKNVTHLTLRANNIAGLHFEVFRCIPNIQYLAIGFNLLNEIHTRWGIVNLRYLEMFFIAIPYQLITRLKHIDLSYYSKAANLYDDDFRYASFKDLFVYSGEEVYDFDLSVPESNDKNDHVNTFVFEYIYATNIQLSDEWETIPFGNLYSLIYLDLSYNQGTKKLVSSINEIPNLEIFKCKGCHLGKLDDNVLQHLTKLLHIDISDNSVGIYDNRFPEIFQPLDKLKRLNLSYNKIRHLAWDTFTTLVSLEYIDLSGNSLKYIESVFLSENLIYINLFFNKLENDFLSLEVRQNLTHVSRNVTIELGPDMVCSCNSTDFFEWVEINSQVSMSADEQMSTCTFNERTFPLHNAMNKLTNARECTGIVVPIIVASSLFGAFILGLSIAIYKYKIYIRYMLYKCKHRMFRSRIISDETKSDYDVYLSVAYGDLAWAKDVILQHLESKDDLKVYLYERDSVAGDTIADNIFHGLTNSSSVIVVLSPHFIKDEWRDWELSMAVASGKSRIAIVKIGDINSPDLKISTMLKSLLMPSPSVTYHEWEPGSCSDDVLLSALELHVQQNKKYDSNADMSFDNPLSTII